MTNTFNNPFPSGSADPCPTGCTPDTDCTLICGFDPGCAASGCADLFNQNKFLNGYISGFSSKLGFGGSESTVNVDLIFPSNECATSGCAPCPDTDDYIGRIGYIYSVCLGQFSFRGILNNHTYSSDNSGYKYRVTLIDGRSIMSNVTVILNTIYDRPPQKLETTLLSAIYYLEPSLDDCDGSDKCKDFMKSGANKKGIFLRKAFEKLDKKQIQVPISKICLTLDFTKLIQIIPDNYRTSSPESSLLDLISLACEETGYDFFCNISNDNKIEVIPVNYKKAVIGTPLLEFIDNFNENNIVMSKEYGEEMSFEKNKRIVFGDFYHYLTTVISPSYLTGAPDSTSCTYTAPQPQDCAIINPPFTKLVTRDTDNPIEAPSGTIPECSSTCT